MSIATQLTSIASTKTAIKTAIEGKGQTVGSIPFANYAAKITAITSGGPAAYVRPTDWLAMPTIAATEQKIAMLVAVYDIEPNWITFTVAGAYTVDWGDGSAPENFAASTTASHTYVYANISSATATIRGYRQAIITVTPQAGQNFTGFIGCGTAKHPSQPATLTFINPYLDIIVSGPSLTNIIINGANSILYGSALICERVEIKSCGTSASLGVLGVSCFQGMKELRQVIYPATITANGASLFSGCNQIDTIPPFVLGTGVSITGMFNGCFALINNPAISWAPSTGFTTALQAFQNCGRLTDPKLTITGSVKMTITDNMFTGCAALVDMPNFDLSGVITASSMFSNCYALRNVVPLNLSACTNMSSMFASCYAMEIAPVITTTSALINLSGTFGTCYTMTKVPNFYTNNVTTMSSIFANCTSLIDAGSLNASAATTIGTPFTSCGSLSKGGLVGTNNNHTYANCRFSGTELNTIYTNLSATGAGKTITVTGNYGTTTDNPAIATAKGWVVTG
jgi:hypothetical protein